MDFFKEWCLCVCTALIIAVVFSMFTPQGAMKKFWKVTLSVFIFVSFIYPFKDFDAADFSLDNSGSIFSLEENSGSIYENEINAQIKAFLKVKGIIGANVKSRVKYDLDTSEIEIKEVEIFIPDDYDSDEVKKLVFNELGINARVVYLGG